MPVVLFGVAVSVDGLFQALAALECHDAAGGDFDRFLGADIAAHAGGPLFDLECAEAGDLHAAVVYDGVLQSVDEGVCQPLGRCAGCDVVRMVGVLNHLEDFGFEFGLGKHM